MAYILTKNRPENTLEEWQKNWTEYQSYLDSIKDSLPKSAYEFAAVPWHYDFSDQRAPHDSWLEAIVIKEPFHGERSQYRTIEIAIRLFGAYHDGHIELTYSNVQSYSFEAPFADFHPESDNKGHQDWLYDEVRLSDRGNVLHEIEWSGGSRWLIESKDIVYQWLPI
jgi:hypothetical protein